MNVRENARAMGVPPDSPLMSSLLSDSLTAIQSVRCLGRAVHVGVATRIVELLLTEGVIFPGMTYGSAYSGVDTFAAAVDLVLAGNWTYAYASEPLLYARRALLRAWGCRGLDEGGCYYDAAGADAIAAPRTDMEVYTGQCGPYSDSDRDHDEDDQLTSLAHLCQSLEHARRSAPAVIVVENVHKPSVVGPVTCFLSKFSGYRMRHGPLCALAVGGSHAKRTRHYWVLTKV